MKTKTLGIIIIVLGIIMIVYTRFNFKTTEKVVDLGSVEITKEKSHPIKWSPIVGVALLIGGILIVVLDKKDNA